VVLFGQGWDGGEVDVELVAGDDLVDGGSNSPPPTAPADSWASVVA
jgi:hypothetical protein